jgi:hypothetical protein
MFRGAVTLDKNTVINFLNSHGVDLVQWVADKLDNPKIVYMHSNIFVVGESTEFSVAKSSMESYPLYSLRFFGVDLLDYAFEELRFQSVVL